MPSVLDWSWGRVGGTDRSHAQAVAASGAEGAMRYLCYLVDGIKRLSLGELRELLAVGRKVGLVWETTANRARAGFAAGASDAMEANRQADALGIPRDRPIFYAVDEDAATSAVLPYFQGVASVGGRPWGIYGKYDLIEYFHQLTVWLWQCAAWSGFGNGSGGQIQGRRLSKHAVLFQRVGYVLNDTCDTNDVLAADWGGFHPDHRTAPQEDDMADLSEASINALVARIQTEFVNDDTRTAAFLGAAFAAQTKAVVEAVKTTIAGGEVDVEALSLQVAHEVVAVIAERLTVPDIEPAHTLEG